MPKDDTPVFENPQAHRKECTKFEHFYSVPKVESSKNPYFKRVEKVKRQKEAATSLYASLKSSKLKKGSVIALDIKSKEIKLIAKQAGIKLVKSSNLDEAMPIIAQSQFIIIDKPSTLLDCLELRSETRLSYELPEVSLLKTTAFRGLGSVTYMIAEVSSCSALEETIS